MSEHLNSVSSNRESTITTWAKIIEEAKRHRDLMFASLEKYRKAVERAMSEIENSKAAAADVLMHKNIVEEHIAMLATFKAMRDDEGARNDEDGE